MAPLEKYMIEQGAPTLASLKTGTLFCVDTPETGELLRQIGQWDRRLSGKGISITLLRYNGRRALVYMYRRSQLERDRRAQLSCWPGAATPRRSRNTPSPGCVSASAREPSSRTRSACSWAIRSATCSATSKTGDATASSRAGGRSTATSRARRDSSSASAAAGTYTPGSGAEEKRCSS